MEMSQQPFSDSFSYRWLINVKSATGVDSLSDSHRSSFIDMYPPALVSMRWMSNTTYDLDFNFPTSESSSVQVHADQLFSGGLVLPLPATAARRLAISSTCPLLHSAKVNDDAPDPISSCSSSKGCNLKVHFACDCLKSSKKRLWRCLRYVILFCKKMKCRLRLVSSRDCKDSVAPRKVNNSNTLISNLEWCRNDADILVYDAILHCKRSFGQDGN
ncbi:putative membrane-associated kinase regulator 6 [Canna indica]|uniref:Membrane-associated kinase regulator 6 n=1 Tax=Canna indica TaxID=4628 RepID=A0AAQ3K1B4_9LILI|nr:putative membrane-associated kinase regulator 6 [Canna indica]